MTELFHEPPRGADTTKTLPKDTQLSAASGGRKPVRLLREHERVEGAFSVANAQLGTTRSDKPYLRCLVGDRTGQIPARMWTIDEQTFRRIPTDGFVWLEGETQPFQGELQLIIRTIDRIEASTEQLRDLLPVADRPPMEMMAELKAILGSLRHPAAVALAEAYLNDKFLMDAFEICPAAKSMHHAYLGGLLEHTLQLLKIGDAICPLYPKLDRDIVLLGLFIHDLGKTRELVYDRTFGYTDRGELVGHIVEGTFMLREKAAEAMRASGQRLPSGFIMVLEHIILSHHSVPEYGAAKIPATPEAILVACLDNLDAKTAMALASARPDIMGAADPGGNFTERSWALGTKLYRPNPLAD